MEGFEYFPPPLKSYLLVYLYQLTSFFINLSLIFLASRSNILIKSWPIQLWYQTMNQAVVNHSIIIFLHDVEKRKQTLLYLSFIYFYTEFFFTSETSEKFQVKSLVQNIPNFFFKNVRKTREFPTSYRGKMYHSVTYNEKLKSSLTEKKSWHT